MTWAASGGGVEGLGDADGEPTEAIEATGEGTGDPGGEASDSSLMSIRVFYVSSETLAVLCTLHKHMRAHC